MSIDTERWATAIGARGLSVIRTGRGAKQARLVCEGATAEDAQRIAVLPEALALLKRIQEWDERSRDCPEAAGRCPLPEISELLRRAGVSE